MSQGRAEALPIIFPSPQEQVQRNSNAWLTLFHHGTVSLGNAFDLISSSGRTDSKMQSQTSRALRACPRDTDMEDTGYHTTKISEIIAIKINKQLHEATDEIK